MIYKQLRQDLDLCGNSFARYAEKCSTQIYRALYGDAMLMPMYMGTSLRSSLFRFLLARKSESQGEVARTHGAKAKRGTLLMLLCILAICLVLKFLPFLPL